MGLENIPSVVELIQSPLTKFIYLTANDCGYLVSKQELIFNWIHPLFLKTKLAANKEDNLTWREATRRKFADQYWETAKTEIQMLEEMNYWEVVKRTVKINVLPVTCAFKWKRYPNGLINKFKT